MIAPEAGLSVSRQCALLGMARSSHPNQVWKNRHGAGQQGRGVPADRRQLSG